MNRAVAKVPRFDGLRPASEVTSRTASKASAKRDTKCEVLLRKSLTALGLRYRLDVATLPGRPDIVFHRAKVAVFCDGDFWHGRHLAKRVAALSRGHNAGYWIEKVRTNVVRDRKRDKELKALGWRTMRFWETDILSAPDVVAGRVAVAVAQRS